MTRPEDIKLFSYDEISRFTIGDVHDLYKRFVNPGQVELLASFGAGRVLADSAAGNKIHCRDGRVIYDFTGGVGVLNHGHNHPEILEVRKRFQAENRMEVHKNFLSPYVAGLSANIAALMPGDLKISYFCNSGAEAVEGAVKLAYKVHNGRRTRILAADISFHGKLLGPEVPFTWPSIPNIDRFIYNELQSVKALVEKHRLPGGESGYYCLLVEPFSASSLRECDTEFLRGLRELCDREDIVLVFDEVYTGWAKTGALFNCFRHQVIPDILAMSKSFGAGKASIAGYVTRTPVFARAYGKLNDAIMHSTTYNGFGEECVTASEGIRITVRDKYCEKALAIEAALKPRLLKLAQDNGDFITEVRGRGGLLGCLFNDEVSPLIKAALAMVPSDFVRDDRFIAKLVTGAVISELFNKHKILTYFGSNREIPFVIAPPLITAREDLDYFAESLASVLKQGRLKLVLKYIAYKYGGQA